ncbi:MAG: hypothetical protein ACK5ZY_00845 [Cyclobacteriaceae bacterium]|jgi:hypothetical protein
MDSNQKYCVGSPKMVAVPYTGQYDPVIVGTKKEVEKWLSNFWKKIYSK